MRRPLVVGALALTLALVNTPASARSGFQETDLVSDITGRAAHLDGALVNPWGIVATQGDFRIANNGKGISTMYSATGDSVGPDIVIPPPGAGVPTGIVLNTLSGFKVTYGGKSGHSRFIFAGEDGTISAFSPGVNPDSAIQVAQVTDAIYKGLAEGENSDGAYLFATNFHSGKVDVFDKHFAPVTWDGAFVDTAIAEGYAPFGILNHGEKLYVSFAKQNGHDDAAGAGFGFVDVFDTKGRLLKRLVAHGPLNAPWGMALAPSGFGDLGDALLVGNFGDGRINAFDPGTGDSVGVVADTSGVPVVIEGLWGLTFASGSGGNDDDDEEDDDSARGAQPEHGGHGNGDGDGHGHGGGEGHGDDNGHGHGHGDDDGHGHGHGDDDGHGKKGAQLFFTAGISGEDHGLFGFLSPVPGTSNHRKDDDRATRGRNGQALQVTVIRGNPARLSDPAGVQWNVSSTVPDVVRLEIYDASGRLIAVPVRNLPFSGAIVARWDLHDSRGAKVPAGLYFYRGTTAAGVASGRLVLLH